MADLSPIIYHSTADDDDLGTDPAAAWKLVSKIHGQVEKGTGRPNVPRILYVSESESGGVDAALAEITAATIEDSDPVIVQMGPGRFDASKIKFSGFTNVHLMGSPGTIVEVTAGLAGTPASGTGYPNSLRFDNNIRCSLQNFDIEMVDDVAAVAVPSGAIARSSNNNGHECIFRNLNIRVNEIDDTRTGTGNALLGIDLIGVTSGSGAVFGLVMHGVNIMSSQSGMVIPGGITLMDGCNIWFGNTARTGTRPRVVGLDWKFTGRWQMTGGFLTTGYDAANPNTSSPAYGLRGNQATTGGRGHMHGVYSIVRNDGTGQPRAVHMTGTTADPWLRITGSYMQAESSAGAVKRAIETDWNPVTQPNAGNRIQLDGNIRIQGIAGNALGSDGKVNVAGSITLQHSYKGNYFVDTTAGAVDLTLHSNAGSANGWDNIKHSAGTNVCTLKTNAAESDRLDGALDGSIAIPPKGALQVRGRLDDGTDLWFETVNHNWIDGEEGRTWLIDGAVADEVDAAPPVTIVAGANETVTLIRIESRTISGTVVYQVQKNGTNITGATDTATSTGDTATLGTPEAIASGDYLSLDTSAGSTPVGLSVTLVFRRVNVTKAA